MAASAGGVLQLDGVQRRGRRSGSRSQGYGGPTVQVRCSEGEMRGRETQSGAPAARSLQGSWRGVGRSSGESMQVLPLSPSLIKAPRQRPKLPPATLKSLYGPLSTRRSAPRSRPSMASFSPLLSNRLRVDAELVRRMT